MGALSPGVKAPPVLATSAENRLEIVDFHGEVTVIDLPVDGLDPTAIQTTDVRYHKGYFAVRRQWLPDGAKFNDASTALTVVDTEGTVLWHRSEDGYRVGSYFVLEDGSVIANKTYAWKKDVPYKADALWIASDGSAQDIPDWVVLGPPMYLPNFFGQRMVPVRENTGADRLGWYDLDTGSFTQVAAGEMSPFVTYFQNYFVWLEDGEAAPQLRVASLGQAAQILPLTDIPMTDNLQLVELAAPHWLRIVDYAAAKSWRVKLDFSSFGASVAEVLPIDNTPPEGLEELANMCGGTPVTMDQSGRLLFFLRDTHQAWAYRMDPATQVFEAIGAPMAYMAGGDIYNTQDSYVVHAIDNSETFCPVTDWDLSPENTTTLIGNSTQVVHPSTGNTYVIEGLTWGHHITLDSMGVCFLSEQWDEAAGANQYVVTDILDGKATALSLSKYPYWLN